MSATLEHMLRMVLMNQVEVMTALDELLGPEADTEDDIATRAEIQANLNEAIEHTLASLKELNQPSSTSGTA
jgi:hypothetical protein